MDSTIIMVKYFSLQDLLLNVLSSEHQKAFLRGSPLAHGRTLLLVDTVFKNTTNVNLDFLQQ